MSGENVEVDVTVTDDTETENDTHTEAVATDHVIDAAVESGISAERASDDAENAQESAQDANVSAMVADSAATDAENAADRTERMLAMMGTLTQQNAELLAAMQAQQSQQLAGTVTELPDADAINPEVDVAPESTHWLQRRWGRPLFGKKGE